MYYKFTNLERQNHCYNFVFAEKCTKRRKAVQKTVKAFEYFLEFEHLFANEMAPKYTQL